MSKHCFISERLRSFCQQTGISDVTLHRSMCGQEHTTSSDQSALLFNPYEENQQVLQAWIEYRQIKPQDLDLIQAIVDDMGQNGNDPPFAGFTNFNPRDVSQDFLKTWLSWYGVGTASASAPKSEWEELAGKIMANQSSDPDGSNSSFETLVALQNQRKNLGMFFRNLSVFLGNLSHEQYEYLRYNTEDKRPTPIQSKVLLSKLLAASFIATPLVVNLYKDEGKQQQMKNFLVKNFMPVIGASAGVGWLTKQLGIENSKFFQQLAVASVSDVIAGKYFPKKVANTLISQWGGDSVTGKLALKTLLDAAVSS